MSDPYAAAHRLGKAFYGKTVLEDVSFSVEPGDIVGVLGKNGAGKTHAARAHARLQPADRGQRRGVRASELPAAGRRGKRGSALCRSKTSS